MYELPKRRKLTRKSASSVAGMEVNILKKFSDLKQDDMLLVQMDADNPAVVPRPKCYIQFGQEKPFRAWIAAGFHVLFNENDILFLLKEEEADNREFSELPENWASSMFEAVKDLQVMRDFLNALNLASALNGNYFKGEEITFDAEHNENCLKYKRGCICLKCKYDYCECCIAVDECPIYTCPHFMEEESHE